MQDIYTYVASILINLTSVYYGALRAGGRGLIKRVYNLYACENSETHHILWLCSGENAGKSINCCLPMMYFLISLPCIWRPLANVSPAARLYCSMAFYSMYGILWLEKATIVALPTDSAC